MSNKVHNHTHLFPSVILLCRYLPFVRIPPLETVRSRSFQSRHPTPAVSPGREASNPFSRLSTPPTAPPESLLDALTSKLGGAKTPGANGAASAANGARGFQTTHHGSQGSQPRVQRRASRSSAHRNTSRSLSGARHDATTHSQKWHVEGNPHVSAVAPHSITLPTLNICSP